MRRIALYEDRCAADFTPIALLRPVFELRCGHFTPRERWTAALPGTVWGALLRPWLAESCREAHPGSPVNDESWLRSGETLLVNGRWLGEPEALQQADLRHVGVVGDEIAWLLIDGDEAALLDPDQCDDGLARIAATRKPLPAGGVMLRRPWDLIENNPRQLESDFRWRDRGPSKADLGAQVAVQGRDSDVFIHPTAEIDPFVVIDARHGPVWVDAGARVLAFTRIEGPCFVGRETQLFRAHVREGTSIGPVCRVGGEIEESIFQGYANKYHDGFLGHSFVCPWVNLGALTTNSDLKNDYSNVKVPLAGEPIDTGATKVGCFIGDHTKSALGCLFNTGSSIGVMTMLLPAGELLPKHVPSFTRYWHGQLDDLPGGLDSSLGAACIAMGRRKQSLTPALERLLRQIHLRTAAERRLALGRTAGPAPVRNALEVRV
jgi:UDP-N-acetylglucosamine diphosphorylase/glucosamine-1-phosphate N-acetyltransferase